jgi:large subunit ribosomal protein L13
MATYLCPRFGAPVPVWTGPTAGIEKTYFPFSKIFFVNTLSYRTHSVSKEEVQRKWYIVDAEGMTLGRLSSRIALVLRGKHRATYTPHTDCGDYVIVINADKVRLTGDKMQNKVYLTFSGYPGGQKQMTAHNVLQRKPIALIETAVRGMLPKNKLGRAMFKKLFAYAGSEHAHAAQQPEPFKF